MTIKLKRKTHSLGNGSYALVLPHDWCTCHIDGSREVTLVGDKVLLIVPPGLEQEAARMLQEVTHAD